VFPRGLGGVCERTGRPRSFDGVSPGRVSKERSSVAANGVIVTEEGSTALWADRIWRTTNCGRTRVWGSGDEICVSLFGCERRGEEDLSHKRRFPKEDEVSSASGNLT